MKHLLLATALWALGSSGVALAHDGQTHEGQTGQSHESKLPVADSNAPVAIDARPHEDEERARNYFTDLAVVDQDGRTLRFYSDVLRGRVVLINFMYTNCENGCPISTEQLGAVKARLGERFGSEVFFVSISTDSERDRPEDLKAFAKKFNADDPGWIFLTGDKVNLDKIIQRLGQYSPVPEEHSSLMLAGNVDTRHWVKLRPNAPLPAMAYKLEALADETVAQR